MRRRISSPRARVARAVAAAALAVASTVALAGCGTAPWDQTQFNTNAAGPSASPVIPSTAPATITPIVNELATGSTQHQLQAGDISLTVNYWSTLNMGEWTPEANKPISFSMVGSLGSDQGQQIYLSRVTLTPSVDGADGALSAPQALSDQAPIAPGYLVKNPYSYSQTFIIPAVDPAATSMTLSFTYEILLQSTPTSSEYAKQTAYDQLTIALAT
ncbi:hypothetical protein [Cnuibacter physcomitrellae]|uniref:hypothetical protein n=1 Tax=Cnuibacter physcomitrellae TaxID=1619308 RepID=UPI001E41E6C8|nr:hypothetical protein [Cnuibacter physcomitrellae]MCS5496076.1 hypothetical protein [Cnuibacter physcomitrellae]